MRAASASRLSFSRGTLVLEGTGAGEVRRVFGEGAWAWDSRAGCFRRDAFAYEETVRRLRAANLPVEDSVPQWFALGWPKVDLPTLRPDQRGAVAAWMESRRGVIVMPTGTGKTEVALAILRDTAVSALVVAPVRDLMYQWHRRILKGLGYDAGILGDNTYNVKPLTVTTYDSACIHMETIGARFKLLIFDECHHLPGPVRSDAARMSAAPWRLGLTATPERSDGRHRDLDALVGPVLYRMPVPAARGKILADYEVVRVPVHLSEAEQARYDELSGQVRAYVAERRVADPAFTWEDLCADTAADPRARRVQKAFFAKQAIEDRAEEKLRVLEDIFRLHPEERVIVFAGCNAMAREVSLRFLVPCLLSHCGKRERLDVLEGLQAGTYKALVANRVLDEGVDLPEAKVAVVLGGLGSARQAKQRLGRILRKRDEARATLYEVVCADTGEEERSRRRRRSDAYGPARRKPARSGVRARGNQGHV
jgi:superfamily II DNA or RNA helicase